MPSIRAVEAAPYYPCYAPLVGGMPGATGDASGPLLDSENGVGMGAGPWNGLFDGEEEGRAAAADGSSSWMDPSSLLEVSAFRKGTAAEGFVEHEDAWGPWHGKLVDSTARKYHFGSEYSEWLDDKHPAICEENVRAPCNMSGTSVLGTRALQKGLSYFRSPDPISMTEDCNAYNSNSSYDRYIAQLVSCSTDAMVCYPDTYSSAELYAPSARRVSSSMDLSMSTNTYCATQNANLYKVKHDYADYIPGKRNELSINQNAGSKDGYTERSTASNYMKTNNRDFVESSLTRKGFLLGSDSTTGNSTDCLAEIKSAFRVTHLNLPNPFPYECGSVKPDDFVQTSLETLDQLNHAVDSPCWKGAPASRQYPFDVGEKIDPHPLVKESKGSHALVQGQKQTVSALNSLSSPEQDGRLICIETRNNSHLSLLREFSPVVSLPSRDEKFQDANERESNYATVGNEKGSLYSDVFGGQNTEALKYIKKASEPKECGAKQICNGGGVVSVDQLIFAGEINLETSLKDVAQESSSDHGNYASDHVTSSSISGVSVPGDIIEPLGLSDPAGKCSSPGKDAQVYVKAMHDLSEMLLSIYNGDADELKEHDQELVQLVIDSLKALILKSRKGATKGSSLLNGSETSQSQVTALKADTAMNWGNIKSTQDMKGKMHCIGSSTCSDKFDISSPKGVAKDFGKFNGTALVLEKALEESLHEQEENPQILLYKNLWIEAEVALCSLKYELQLARLKLQLENHKNQTAANSHDSPEVAKKPTQVARLSSLNSMPLDRHDVPRCKSQESSCYNTSNLGDKLDKSSYQKPQEANTNKANEVDSSIMARFRVLKGRDEKLSSPSEEEQQKLAVDSSHPDSGNNTRFKVQLTKLADLGFMEGNPQPSTEAEPRGGSKFAKLRPDIQHLGANYKEENGLPPVNSEHATTGRSQIWTADGQSYLANGKGKSLLSGGYDSSLSEWEDVDVLDEELAWYNSP